MQIRSRIKNLLSPYPRLFIPAYRRAARSGFKHLVISPETEIVIEGFPRTANTFAVVGFEQAQDRPVSIAHHTHAEAQIIEGVRRQLPVIALIRAPADSISSLRVMGEFDPNPALDRWMQFYAAVEKRRDQLIVAEFTRVTAQLGAIIGEVNAKFGTAFGRFPDTDEARQSVFAKMDRINAANPLSSTMWMARPTEAKKAAQDALCLQFDPHKLAQAEACFHRLTR